MDYTKFIASKARLFEPCGFKAKNTNTRLFDWQQKIVEMACAMGRFGGFQDCGLGKTFQQLECARQIYMHTNKPVLIFAPLAVAEQTKREASKFGIDCDVTVCKHASDVRHGINVTNYERLHHFNSHGIGGVILDEGSIIKSIDGKTKTALMHQFAPVQYKQTWTATPAPNDYTEMGNQSEFLGILSREQMLATYFIHDGGDTSKWRLKGHGHEKFWEWMASWSVMIRSPLDIGFHQEGYTLPDLHYHGHTVVARTKPNGMLFDVESKTLAERREAKKRSVKERCQKAADLVNDSREPWVLWCNLNTEGDLLERLIPDAIQVAGCHSTDEKEDKLSAFTCGDVRVLITKPKIGGFGLNWQHCPNTVIFPTDSWEQWYQMIRRFYRFGQSQPVHVHYVICEAESVIVNNIMDKESRAQSMYEGIVSRMAEYTQKRIQKSINQTIRYNATKSMEQPIWLQ